MVKVVLLWRIGSGVLAVFPFVGSMFAMFLVFAMIAKEIGHVGGEVFESVVL